MSRAADHAAAADDVDLEDLARADLDLSDAIRALEVVDWGDVPTVSTAEAAAFTQRLIEARDAVQTAAEASEVDG